MLDVRQTQDLAACLELRRAVFIDEQGVSEEVELDGRDDEALHVLARLEGRPVGCARLFIDGEAAKIGRVCVLNHMRAHGLGKAIMQACLDIIRKQPNVGRVKLSAQVPVIGFYERLGFVADGPVYEEDGIPHRAMELML